MSADLGVDPNSKQFQVKQEEFPTLRATQVKKKKRRRRTKQEKKSSSVADQVIAISDATKEDVIQASESIGKKKKVVQLKQPSPEINSQSTPQETKASVDTIEKVAVDKGILTTTATTVVNADQDGVKVKGENSIPEDDADLEVAISKPIEIRPPEMTEIQTEEKVDAELIEESSTVVQTVASTPDEKSAEESITELNEAVIKAEEYKELLAGINAIAAGASEVRYEILLGYFKKYQAEIDPFLKSFSKLRADLKLILENANTSYDDHVYTPLKKSEIKMFKNLKKDTEAMLKTEKEHESALHAFDKQRKQISVALGWLSKRESEVTIALSTLKNSVEKKELQAEEKDTEVIIGLVEYQKRIMALREAVRLSNFSNNALTKRNGNTFRLELEGFEKEFQGIEVEELEMGDDTERKDLKSMYHAQKDLVEKELKRLEQVVKDNVHIHFSAATKAKSLKLNLTAEDTERDLDIRKINREVAETQRALINALWKQINLRIDDLVNEMNKLNYSVNNNGACVGTFTWGVTQKYISPVKEKRIVTDK